MSAENDNTPGTTEIPPKEQREIAKMFDLQFANLPIHTPGAFVVRLTTQPKDGDEFNRLARNIRAALDSKGFADTMVMVLVGEAVTLESIDARMMFNAGWLHKDKVAKLLDQFGTNGGDKSTLEVIAAIRNVVELPIETKGGVVNPDAKPSDDGDSYGG